MYTKKLHLLSSSNGQAFMLPKIIRTGIHRYKGTGVRKTQMATQYRKAYVPVTLDVDKEGAIYDLDNIEIVWKFKDFLTTSEGEAK